MDIFFESIGFGLAVLFIVVGIIGVIIPAIPGVLLVWLTVVVYAYLEGFTAIGYPSVIVVTVIAAVTGSADLWLPMLGAKATGASGWAMAGGAIGSMIGLLAGAFALVGVGALPGAIVGYVLGTVGGEYYKVRDWRQAVKSGFGTLAGMGVSTLVQLVGALLIAGIFVWQALAG